MSQRRESRLVVGLRAIVALASLVGAAACANPMAVEEALQASPHTTSSGNHTISSGNAAPSSR